MLTETVISQIALKYQKLLIELTIKLNMWNQQQKSEINCPMNVDSCSNSV